MVRFERERCQQRLTMHHSKPKASLTLPPKELLLSIKDVMEVSDTACLSLCKP